VRHVQRNRAGQLLSRLFLVLEIAPRSWAARCAARPFGSRSSSWRPPDWQASCW
jgi:hypothetical protein